MAEYIDRKKVLDLAKTFSLDIDLGEDSSFLSFTCVTTNDIKTIPAADVRPVRRGKWTLNKDGSGTCSECGFVQNSCWDLDNWDNFCHHCGADMRTTT